MTMSEAKKTGILARGVRAATAMACVLGLSACVGGTTYGTGVSQEEQTLKDVYNMFSLKSESKDIDYSPRPDLIVPENTAALPEPLDSEVTTSNPEWPETPEQRIARVRAEAGGIDPRSGDYSIEDQLRKKEGIGIETRNPKGEFVVGKTDRDGNRLLSLPGDDEARKQVLKAKADLNYSHGGQRRFLTEPPVEYRIAVDSAPQGEEAFTEEELTAREEARAKHERGYSEIKPLSSRD